MNSRYESWIDNIKLFACILVVLGHFFQSMVAADILPDTRLYAWFNTTIYFIHVPLFLLCSGYLYQKTRKVDSLAAWKKHIAEKTFTLGIPYFVFSVATWLLKRIFSGSVNRQAENLMETLFLSPLSPYWYLYSLFFMFLLIPTFRGQKSVAVGLIISGVMQAAYIFIPDLGVTVLSQLCANILWFTIGMLLCYNGVPERCVAGTNRLYGVGLTEVFLVASVVLVCLDIDNKILSLGMGVLGTAGALLLAWNLCTEPSKICRILSGYTMPIFLMHTIFAAGIRAVLMKLGVTSPMIHIVIGLTASFLGPVAAMEIMKRLRLDFLVYPARLLRKKDLGANLCLKN